MISNKRFHKKLSILGVKYAPSIMALSCCLKLMFLDLSNHSHTWQLLVVNLINLLLNVAITYWVFSLGRAFGFCWKHRVLCKAAYIGYFMFLMFVVLKVDKGVAFPIVLSYASVISTMTITFSITEKCNHVK